MVFLKVDKKAKTISKNPMCGIEKIIHLRQNLLK
jgi:hypothetical protein